MRFIILACIAGGAMLCIGLLLIETTQREAVAYGLLLILLGAITEFSVLALAGKRHP